MASATQLVNQRYQSHSCTLEITAVQAALSQWSQYPVLKQVRFQLWMNDPDAAQPNLIAQGDQTQLQRLTTAVQQYIQAHLTQTDRPMPALPRVEEGSGWPLAQHQVPVVGQPQPLTLSTLGLFEVAEVLDQCEYGSQLLPALPSVANRRRRPISLWAGSAVAALVLAVGVTATLRQSYLQSPTTQSDQALPEATLDSDTAAGNSGLSPTPPSAEVAESAPEQALAQEPGLAETQPSPETANQKIAAADSPATTLERGSAEPSGLPQATTPGTPSPGRSPSASRPRPAPSPTAMAQGTRPDTSSERSDPAQQSATIPADEINPGEAALSATESGQDSVITTPSAAPPPQGAAARAPSAPPTVADSEPESPPDAGNQHFSTERRGTSGTPAPALSPFSPTRNQVLAYFQLRWQGNDGNEPLIYALSLNPNGTIADWQPLNSAATRQQWTFPTDALVSPFDYNGILRLQVILYPDGQIQVTTAVE
jgi:hypothetical protein